MPMCLYVLDCDIECISYHGSWSKGLKAIAVLKSYTWHCSKQPTLIYLILQPYEVGTLTDGEAEAQRS